MTALLDNPRIGVLHLDRRGRIMAANDRARSILGHGDGLSDPDGVLRARAPADQDGLERLVGNALPVSGGAAVSGSMLLRRSPALPPFVVHVKPVKVPEPDYGAPHVAALVLVVGPGRRHRVDPRVVARTLGLTPTQSQVAVWLAEGRRVRDMARTTGHSEGTIYWHLKQIYQKQSISRQADLVQWCCRSPSSAEAAGEHRRRPRRLPRERKPGCRGFLPRRRAVDQWPRVAVAATSHKL